MCSDTSTTRYYGIIPSAGELQQESKHAKVVSELVRLGKLLSAENQNRKTYTSFTTTADIIDIIEDVLTRHQYTVTKYYTVLTISWAGPSTRPPIGVDAVAEKYPVVATAATTYVHPHAAAYPAVYASDRTRVYTGGSLYDSVEHDYEDDEMAQIIKENRINSYLGSSSG